LESCNALEEVHVLLLNFLRLPRSLESLFSSITSKKLRKISLTFMDFVDDDDSEDEGDEYEDEDEDEDEWSVPRARTAPWGSLDTILNRLAHQAQDVEGSLTLQLNIRRVGSKPFKCDHLLPKFLGRGGLVDIKCN
jgi:hypothetical protein